MEIGGANAFDVNLTRPAAGCQHHAGASQRPTLRLDDQVVAGSRYASHAVPFEYLRTVTPRGRSERARQVVRGHESVRRNNQAADRIRGQLRLLGSNSTRVQQTGVDPLSRETLSGGLEPTHGPVVQRDIERPGATIRNVHIARGRDLGDEFVVQLQTPNREARQRSLVPRFDVRREHSGRSLGRAHSDRPIVDDLHRRATPRQLMGHRTADDARTDDDDVATGLHGRNLIAKTG